MVEVHVDLVETSHRPKVTRRGEARVNLEWDELPIAQPALHVQWTQAASSRGDALGGRTDCREVRDQSLGIPGRDHTRAGPGQDRELGREQGAPSVQGGDAHGGARRGKGDAEGDQSVNWCRERRGRLLASRRDDLNTKLAGQADPPPEVVAGLNYRRSFESGREVAERA